MDQSSITKTDLLNYQTLERWNPETEAIFLKEGKLDTCSPEGHEITQQTDTLLANTILQSISHLSRRFDQLHRNMNNKNTFLNYQSDANRIKNIVRIANSILPKLEVLREVIENRDLLRKEQFDSSGMFNKAFSSTPTSVAPILNSPLISLKKFPSSIYFESHIGLKLSPLISKYVVSYSKPDEEEVSYHTYLSFYQSTSTYQSRVEPTFITKFRFVKNPSQKNLATREGFISKATTYSINKSPKRILELLTTFQGLYDKSDEGIIRDVVHQIKPERFKVYSTSDLDTLKRIMQKTEYCYTIINDG